MGRSISEITRVELSVVAVAEQSLQSAASARTPGREAAQPVQIARKLRACLQRVERDRAGDGRRIAGTVAVKKRKKKTITREAENVSVISSRSGGSLVQ